MKLTVKGIFPEHKSFYIYANDEVHKVGGSDKTTVFDLPDNTSCNIGIAEIEEPSNHTILKIIFFIITLPLQVIFRMIFADSDWYETAEPYTVYTDMTPIELSGDTTITFSYFKTKYNSVTDEYSKPVIAVENYEFKNLYERNKYGVSNAYFTFIKNIASCAAVICAIMIACAISSFATHRFGSILCMSIAALCIIACVVIAIIQYKKIKKISIDKNDK